MLLFRWWFSPFPRGNLHDLNRWNRCTTISTNVYTAVVNDESVGAVHIRFNSLALCSALETRSSPSRRFDAYPIFLAILMASRPFWWSFRMRFSFWFKRCIARSCLFRIKDSDLSVVLSVFDPSIFQPGIYCKSFLLGSLRFFVAHGEGAQMDSSSFGKR